ncbi:MAG: GAD domain-containing protein [Burkholderiaceae bacterium]
MVPRAWPGSRSTRWQGRDGLQSPIVKNIHDTALTEILKRTKAQDGDILFFVRTRPRW